METNKKNSDSSKDDSGHQYNEDQNKQDPHANDYSEDDTKYASPDKYLAMEQPGVTYTGQEHPISNSDSFEFSNEEASGKWKAKGQNSLNADAFSQDDYILSDNIDLDEDQSQSISSEDDIDTNTTDG